MKRSSQSTSSNRMIYKEWRSPVLVSLLLLSTSCHGQRAVQSSSNSSAQQGSSQSFNFNSTLGSTVSSPPPTSAPSFKTATPAPTYFITSAPAATPTRAPSAPAATPTRTPSAPAATPTRKPSAPASPRTRTPSAASVTATPAPTPLSTARQTKGNAPQVVTDDVQTSAANAPPPAGKAAHDNGHNNGPAGPPTTVGGSIGDKFKNVTQQAGNKLSNPGAIAGIALGVVALILLCVILVCFCGVCAACGCAASRNRKDKKGKTSQDATYGGKNSNGTRPDLTNEDFEDGDDISELGGSKRTLYPPTELFLPSGNASVTTEMMDDGTFSPNGGTPTVYSSGIREVTTTRGKLGLVVEDATREGTGPVVTSLKPDSPLADQVKVGDSIVGVNGQDTRHMSVQQMTEILAEANGPNLKLQVKKGGGGMDF